MAMITSMKKDKYAWIFRSSFPPGFSGFCFDSINVVKPVSLFDMQWWEFLWYQPDLFYLVQLHNT
jgi:hypothetical protein